MQRMGKTSGKQPKSKTLGVPSAKRSRKPKPARCLWCGEPIDGKFAKQFCNFVCLGLAFRERMERQAMAAGEPPLPDRPTECLPGTPGKVEVLAERFRKGQSLWHPQDAHFQPTAY